MIHSQQGDTNFYSADINNQITVKRGSYSLRLVVIDHPLIDGEISVNMGIAKEGDIINTCLFYNTDQTWKNKQNLFRWTKVANFNKVLQINPKFMNIRTAC